MTDTRDPSHYEQQVVLRNGTPVTIRAIRADDIDKVVAAFRKLEPRSIYTRFFSFRKNLSAEELGRLRETDFVHAVVLVVALGPGPGDELIGGGSYNVHEGTQAAELAFTVEEDYQGQGLASTLLAILADIARSRGITRFEADVLPSNTPMLAVFQRSGLPMQRRSVDGVVHVVLDLLAAPATPPGSA